MNNNYFIDTVQHFSDENEGLEISSCITGDNEERWILHLKGYLNSKNSLDFLNVMQRLLIGELPFKLVVFDLKDLVYLSSAGIGALNTLQADAADNGVSVFLSHLNSKITYIMKMLGMLSFFNIIKEPEDPLPEK